MSYGEELSTVMWKQVTIMQPVLLCDCGRIRGSKTKKTEDDKIEMLTRMKSSLVLEHKCARDTSRDTKEDIKVGSF